MSFEIFVNKKDDSSNVLIYNNEEENIFVVIADKEDMPQVCLLEESHKPGIYILINDEKKYVGQATNSIYNRLQNHLKDKKWWNKVIFFGKYDSHISSAQTDYLERKLIKEFNYYNVNLDNNTKGNNSYINRHQIIISNHILESFKNIISIANVNLFDINYEGTKHDNINNNGYIKFMDKVFDSKHIRTNFVEIIKYIIKNMNISDIKEVISNKEPNTVNFIGLRHKTSVKGKKLTKKIEGTPYHLYVNYSKNSIEKKISQLGRLLKVNVDIHF